MNNAIWAAAGMTAIGTVLLRMLPLYVMQRRLHRMSTEEGTTMPTWPGVLAPLIIAALLGLSLVPQNAGPINWSATGAGSLVTLLVWSRTKTLGWPVTLGVAAYALVCWGGS